MSTRFDQAMIAAAIPAAVFASANTRNRQRVCSLLRDRMTLKRPMDFWRLFRQSINGWSADRAPSMGAALAYYTAFSIAPILIIATSIAGLLFGRDAAQGILFDQLADLVGPQAGAAIQTILQNAHRSHDGIVATLIGLGVLIVGATTVFVELQSDLDRIWKVETPIGGGILHFIHSRLLSFGMVMAIGFLLIVSLIVTSLVSAIGTAWGNWFTDLEILLQTLNFVVSFGVITLLFAMIYKILPNARIEWDDVWTGAAVTSLLFAIGKLLIGLYIGKSAIASSYGAAGAFAVLLIWIYYSTQIFLFGAELTYHYSHERGSNSGVAS